MRDAGRTAEERLDSLLALQALLAEVARDIGPGTDLQSVLATVLGAMRTLVKFRGGTICLIDADGVYVAAADPEVSPDVAAARVPLGSGLAGRCITTGEPVYSPDLDVDPRVDRRLRSLGSNRAMRSYLAVPLVCLGEVIGVLQVDSEEVDAFGSDDRRVLAGLAVQVAGAIEGARRFEAMHRLDDARAIFIARVSHELRTPVTILRGFTGTLLSNRDLYGLSGEAVEMLARVDAAGERLQSLVEELLSATRVAAAPEAVAESVVVAEVLHLVREQCESPEHVVIDCPAALVAAVDAELLRQALHLLVENALRYGGGAELRAWSDERSFGVAVVDHGMGIPDERKATVFDRFTRGEHATPGWGLGLSIVHHLAELVGARVTVSDTPGGGATFELRFDSPPLKTLARAADR